jgi:hypothetical protein
VMFTKETRAFVRITQSTGRISLSGPCADFLGNASHVIYLIDREKKRVAIKPSGAAEDAYRIQRSKGQTFVSSIELLRTIGITSNERIDAELSDGMITFSYAADPKPPA